MHLQILCDSSFQTFAWVLSPMEYLRRTVLLILPRSRATCWSALGWELPSGWELSVDLSQGESYQLIRARVREPVDLAQGERYRLIWGRVRATCWSEPGWERPIDLSQGESYLLIWARMRATCWSAPRPRSAGAAPPYLSPVWRCPTPDSRNHPERIISLM